MSAMKATLVGLILLVLASSPLSAQEGPWMRPMDKGRRHDPVDNDFSLMSKYRCTNTTHAAHHGTPTAGLRIERHTSAGRF
jgi:hypothetical protein